MSAIHSVLVTGGAGYVGSVLVPKLLNAGYQVTVLDTYWYGEDVLAAVADHPNLKQIKGDIRHPTTVTPALIGIDAVIHLACISNDPSFELDPALGRSINYDATLSLIDQAKAAGIRRFVYASSSSVYGVKQAAEVTEDLPLKPLTDYSKYKGLCEQYLLQEQTPDFKVLVLRPATVCGYSPRLRLDLTVNILTAHALTRRLLTVYGGQQTRPNIHIADITDLYVKTLIYHDEQIAGKVYNAGYENYSVLAIAEMVQEIVGPDIAIVRQPTDDGRSYRISSQKIKQELGFSATHTVEEAIRDLITAFAENKVPDALTDPRYYNIKTMQNLASVAVSLEGI